MKKVETILRTLFCFALAGGIYAQNPRIDPLPMPPLADPSNPMADVNQLMGKMPERSELYNQFPVQNLPFSVGFSDAITIQEHINLTGIRPISATLKSFFFPIPENPEIRNIYPFGTYQIVENLEAFVCWEEDFDGNWEANIYTFENREFFKQKMTVAMLKNTPEAKILTKSSISNELKIISNSVVETYAKSGLDAAQKLVFKHESSITTQHDKKGGFEPRKELSFAGIFVQKFAQGGGNLPEEIQIEGKQTATVYWRDNSGEHYGIISYSGAEKGEENPKNKPLKLHFYHYNKPNGSPRYEVAHQAIEQTQSCDISAENFLDAPDFFHFSDTDNNGNVEVFIPYWLDCRNTTQKTIQMQVCLWEAKRENRHFATINLQTGAQASTFSSSWSKIPAPTRAYAGKMLEKLAQRTKK